MRSVLTNITNLSQNLDKNIPKNIKFTVHKLPKRTKLIRWLFEVCIDFKYSPYTHIRTVNMIDEYIKNITDKKNSNNKKNNIMNENVECGDRSNVTDTNKKEYTQKNDIAKNKNVEYGDRSNVTDTSKKEYTKNNKNQEYNTNNPLFAKKCADNSFSNNHNNNFDNLHNIDLQLIGITILFICAKVEETKTKCINDYVAVTDYTYTREKILQTEIEILQDIHFTVYNLSNIVNLRNYNTCSSNVHDELLVLLCCYVLENDTKYVVENAKIMVTQILYNGLHSFNKIRMYIEHNEKVMEYIKSSMKKKI